MRQVDAEGDFESSRLGKWVLEDRIGRGGMSEVYKAYHIDTKQQSAIKILMMEGDIHDELIDRFYHEVHILRRLKHPNILDVFEFGFEEDVGFYLVMEFLEGCDLYSYISNFQGDFPFESTFRIIEQICDAMAFAHEKDIVHRDLKPENIFLVGGPESIDHVKVLDFGIAKFQLGESARLTEGGKTLGTPHYISPEQARGDIVGPAADIYSLSVILFEMLTGKTLFQADSPLEYLMRHAYATPPTISQVRMDVVFPRPLSDLTFKGLEKKPEDRPLTMGQLKQWLYEAITGQELSRETIAMAVVGKEALDVGSYHIDAALERDTSEQPAIKPIKLGGGSKARSNEDVSELGLSRLGKGKDRNSPKMPGRPHRDMRAVIQEAPAKPDTPAWKIPAIIGTIILLVAVLSSALTYRFLKPKVRAAVTPPPRLTQARPAASGEVPEVRDAGVAPAPRKGETPAPTRDKADAGDATDAQTDEPPPQRRNWKELIRRKLKKYAPDAGSDGDGPRDRALPGKRTTPLRKAAPRKRATRRTPPKRDAK